MFKNLFGSKKNKLAPEPMLVDIHSHLLPGLDDGVESFDESLDIIREFKKMGFKKLITTPHIMGDFFKNKPEDIHEKLRELNDILVKENIEMIVEAAAEYYLDEWLIDKVDKGEELMTFGDNYVLMETSYINESSHLHQVVFQLKTKGYKPVLAHPERYTYLYDDFNKYQELLNLGVYFQINTISLLGYYSKKAKQIAEKLVENGMVHFLGSDCHGNRHIQALQKTMKEKSYAKALELNLLNYTLI